MRIMANGRLPSSLPGASLADGMPYVATSWLTDVVVAWAANIHPEVISSLMATATTFALILWFWICLQASGRKRFALAATLAIVVYWSFGLGALRSQVFAGMILPTILCLLMPLIQMQDDGDLGRHRLQTLERWRVISIFGLFVLWANLDLSHLIGVAILAGFTVSVAIERMLDRAGSTSFRSFLSDRRFQQWILLTELSMLATILNPAGFSYWKSLLALDMRGPVWSVAGGSYGLQLSTTSGALFGFLLFGVVMLWLYRRWTVRVYEVVITAILVVITALHASCIYWLAPMALFFIARHLRGRASGTHEMDHRVHHYLKYPTDDSGQPLQFAWSLLCLLLIWFGFAFSPMANPVLSSPPRSLNRLYEGNVPQAVGEFFGQVPDGDLNRAISNGFVFAPADWSDWLQWQSGTLATFANSSLDAFPATVQRDYWKIFRGDQGWNLLADQYRVSTIVIDRQRQSRLAAEVARASSKWRLVYESSTAMVLVNTRLGNEPRLVTGQRGPLR